MSKVRNTPDRRVEWVAQAGARAIEEEAVHVGQTDCEIGPAPATGGRAVDEQNRQAGAELLDADLGADPRQSHAPLGRGNPD